MVDIATQAQEKAEILPKQTALSQVRETNHSNPNTPPTARKDAAPSAEKVDQSSKPVATLTSSSSTNKLLGAFKSTKSSAQRGFGNFFRQMKTTSAAVTSRSQRQKNATTAATQALPAVMYSKEASGYVTQREDDASDGGARILKGSRIAGSKPVTDDRSQQKSPAKKTKAKANESETQLQNDNSTLLIDFSQNDAHDVSESVEMTSSMSSQSMSDDTMRALSEVFGTEEGKVDEQTPARQANADECEVNANIDERVLFTLDPQDPFDHVTQLTRANHKLEASHSQPPPRPKRNRYANQMSLDASLAQRSAPVTPARNRFAKSERVEYVMTSCGVVSLLPHQFSDIETKAKEESSAPSVVVTSDAIVDDVSACHAMTTLDLLKVEDKRRVRLSSSDSALASPPRDVTDAKSELTLTSLAPRHIKQRVAMFAKVRRRAAVQASTGATTAQARRAAFFSVAQENVDRADKIFKHSRSKIVLL